MAESLEKSSAFLDYYQTEEIIPVSPKSFDKSIHFAQRDALYRSCGIIPSWVKNKRVFEVGIGTGHNALFTYSLKPSQYVLLDGHMLSIEHTHQNLSEYFGQHSAQLVHSDFLRFESEERFDLVLCEGVIPFQQHPNSFAQKLGGFVAPGGVLLVTAISASSFLSELLRRILAGMCLQELDKVHGTTQEKLDILLPFFEPHLVTLKGMTRKHQDWLLDNILHPFEGEVWGIREAVHALSEDFSFYHASPDFMTDWRWYKEKISDLDSEVKRVTERYEQNLLNFMDYRHVYADIPQEVGQKIEKLSLSIYQLSKANLTTHWQQNQQLLPLLTQLATQLRCLDKPLAILDSLISMIEAFKAYQCQQKDWKKKLTQFEDWFGRGMSYISFIKN